MSNLLGRTPLYFVVIISRIKIEGSIMSLKSTRLLLLCFAVFLQACGSGSNEVPADTTAPVITLTGDNPQAVELNGTYEELGATSDGGERVEID